MITSVVLFLKFSKQILYINSMTPKNFKLIIAIRTDLCDFFYFSHINYDAPKKIIEVLHVTLEVKYLYT